MPIVGRAWPPAPNQKHPDLRIARNLLLIVLVVLLLPYLRGAALPCRPSGLGADGLALADGRAGVAAMDRFRRDFAVPAALGGRGPRTPNSAAITASIGMRCAR